MDFITFVVGAFQSLLKDVFTLFEDLLVTSEFTIFIGVIIWNICCVSTFHDICSFLYSEMLYGDVSKIQIHVNLCINNFVRIVSDPKGVRLCRGLENLSFSCVNLTKNGKSNQGNQGYSGNQNNVIQGQRPDMETDSHNKDHRVTIIIIHTK